MSKGGRGKGNGKTFDYQRRDRVARELRGAVTANADNVSDAVEDFISKWNESTGLRGARPGNLTVETYRLTVEVPHKIAAKGFDRIMEYLDDNGIDEDDECIVSCGEAFMLSYKDK